MTTKKTTRRRKKPVNFFDQFRPFAKAVAGFVTPGLVIFFSSITSGSDGGGSVTGNEWSAIGLAMFATGGAVFAVKNSGNDGTG